MKIQLLTTLLILQSGYIFAQKVNYYSDRARTEKVEKIHAKVFEIITVENEVQVIGLYRLRDSLLLEAKSYKNDQPYRLWKVFDSDGFLYSERNYQFDIDYNTILPDSVFYFDIYGDSLITKKAGLEKPKFQGKSGFLNHLVRNIITPQIGWKNKVEGTIRILVKISKDGRMIPLTIIEGIDHYLDKDAARIIIESPNWTPALLQGNPVDIYAKVNISYRL